MTAYLILGGFLLVTLVLGLWAGKDVKTMKDYVLANRSLNTGGLTLTFLATFIGASHIFVIPNSTYAYGTVVTLPTLSIIFSFLFIGFIIAPNIIHFPNAITMGDVMNHLYGEKIRIFTGIIGALFSVLVVGAQLLSIGKLNALYLEIDIKWLIAISGVTIAIYTSQSGIRSVVISNAIQLVGLVAVLSFITQTAIEKIGGIQVLFNSVPSEKIAFWGSQKAMNIYTKVIIKNLLPVFIISPPFFQYILVHYDQRQVRNMFVNVSLFYGFFRVMLLLISLSALCLPNIDNKQVLPSLVKSLFGNNAYTQTFIVFSLLVVVISTANSFLYAAGILIVHDVIKPLCKSYKINIHEVRIAKWMTLFIGLLATLIAVSKMGIHELTFYALNILSIILVPLILGIIGVKADKKTFIGSLFGSIATFFIAMVFLQSWDLYHSKLKNTIMVFSTLASLCTYLLTHLIQNKGLVIVKPSDDTSKENLWRFSRKKIEKLAKNYVPTLDRILIHAKNKIYTYGGVDEYVFAMFFILNYMIPYFMAVYNHSLITAHWVIALKSIGVLLCVGLMLKKHWPSRLYQYFPIYWFITITYCVPFMATFLFLLDVGSTIWIFNLILAIILFISLLDFNSFFVLSTIGFSLACLLYRLWIGPIEFILSGELTYLLVYGVIFSIVIGLLFIRRKELYTGAQLKKAKLYAGSIAHETNNYLGISMFAGDIINHAVASDKIKPLTGDQSSYTIPKELYENLVFLGPQLSEGAKQSGDKIKMFMSALKEDVLGAKKEVVSVRACVEEALKDTYFQDAKVKKGLLLELDDDFVAKVSKSYFKHILYNIVKNAFYHGDASQVKISLDKAEQKLLIRDNGKGISTDHLPYIFDLFYSSGVSSGIGLALVKVIVESFDAKVHVESKQGKGSFTEFSVAFD